STSSVESSRSSSEMTDYFILIVGLCFVAIAVTMVVRALVAPAGPSTETIEQISAYGFAGTLPTTHDDQGPGLGARLDDLATSAGRYPSQRVSRPPGQDYSPPPRLR